MNATPRRMLVAMRIGPPVDPVDVDAGDRREQDRRNEEGQDQQADRGVRAGRLDDDDGQPVQDHVAADLGRRLRQPETQECRVAEDREGARRVGVAVPARSRARRLGRTGGGERGAQRGIAALDEGREAPLQLPALEQDMAAAALAAQADVRAKPVDQPGVRAARMGAPKPDDVAQEQREDSGVVHPAGQGIKAADDRGSGRASDPWRGSSRRSTGVTVTTTSGCVAASWAMTPPDRVSEPVSCSDAPMASSSNVVVEGVPSRLAAPGGPTATTPGTSRTPAVAIASAPALRSSLMRSSRPCPSIGPLTVIVTPGPATGSRPA